MAVLWLVWGNLIANMCGTNVGVCQKCQDVFDKHKPLHKSLGVLATPLLFYSLLNRLFSHAAIVNTIAEASHAVSSGH